MTNANLETYRKALEQAWKDGHVTADEYATLESLRKTLGVSAEEHMMLESQIKKKTMVESAGEGIKIKELEAGVGVLTPVKCPCGAIMDVRIPPEHQILDIYYSKKSVPVGKRE